jgi:hypothetical protein
MDAKSPRTESKGKRDVRSSEKRDWLAFRRADYLATTVILGVAVLYSVLFGMVRPVIDAMSHATLPMAYRTTVPSGIGLPRGATSDGEATMALLLTNATLGERAGQALPGLLMAAATIAVAWLLFQLLRSTRAGEPFTRRNVRRINTIAFIVGVGGVLTQYAQSFADSAIYTTGRLPDGADLYFEMRLTPLPMVAAIVIGLIGEVFRRGVQLRDDVEGLV